MVLAEVKDRAGQQVGRWTRGQGEVAYSWLCGPLPSPGGSILSAHPGLGGPEGPGSHHRVPSWHFAQAITTLGGRMVQELEWLASLSSKPVCCTRIK